MNNWNLDSWKKHVAKHMPNYENIDELDEKDDEIIDPNVPKDDAKLWKEDQITRHDKYPALVY